MKESLSSFDVRAVVKELQSVVGGRIDKVYHPSSDHLILSVRTAAEGKRLIHFIVGKWLYLSDSAGEMPAQPSDFAMMLRKRITNARICAIRQQGFDRIAVMSLEKEDKYDLVLEMFADGNVILVKDGLIVQPLKSHTWKHRDVRARKDFLFPPPVPDPSGMDPADMLKVLQSSDADLVRTLATKLNMGGRYSEEICLRSGIDKLTRVSDIDLEVSKKVLGTVKDFSAEIDSSSTGQVLLRGEAAEDVVPVDMRTYVEMTSERYPTFSAAIEAYIPRLVKPKKEKPKEEQLERERLNRKLAQQEAAIVKLQDSARTAQTTGDFMFAKYGEVAQILTMAKGAVVDMKGMKDIPGYVSFNPKTSMLRVVIDSVNLDLDIRASIEVNARRYYEGAKRARKKLEGVLAAAEDARKAVADTAVEHESGNVGKKHQPTKRFWFERFRWFISSEGATVLGGKDAKSNDMLVKKHLEAGDRYAHADVHGAPSVVVKMRDGVTEQTLKEACEFAVATSKAWNAKIGSAAGYWVLPEQVSKTPQSGEYLAKGAFVIRGKRNYSDKLEIKLGVGEMQHEGARKIMCGPESAVRKNCTRFVMIRPGERDKNDFAKRLSELFEVPIEEIQSILPPGDLDVVESVGLTVS